MTRRNRTSLKTAMTMALLTLALAVPAQAEKEEKKEKKNKSEEGIGTGEIFAAAVDAFPACLNYCITGISIRLHYDGTTWTIYYSPLIRHNSADFVVQSYDEHGKEPWTEWAAVMGTAQKAALTPVVSSLLGLDELDEYGSGQTRYKDYGRHQAHNMKESDVIGNPFIVLILLLDEEAQNYGYNTGDGEGDQCQTEGCLEKRDDETGETVNRELETDREREQAQEEGRPWYEMTTEEIYAAASKEVQETIGDYKQKIEQCANDLRCVIGIIGSKYFSEAFSVLDTVITAIRRIKQIKKVIEIVKYIVKLIVNYASGGGSSFSVENEVRIERYLCENDHSPFVPYYLSGMDFLFWREGLPLTDPHKALSILNPFSGDGIGPKRQHWGYTYPRQGFVDNPFDAKVGAVTAARSLDIVAEKQRRRLRWNSNGFEKDGRDGWQMIYPDLELVCHANIGDTPVNTIETTPTDPDGLDARYAWNYWRPYACDTNEKGHQIAKIEFAEPICIDVDVDIETSTKGGNDQDDDDNDNDNDGEGGEQESDDA